MKMPRRQWRIRTNNFNWIICRINPYGSLYSANWPLLRCVILILNSEYFAASFRRFCVQIYYYRQKYEFLNYNTNGCIYCFVLPFSNSLTRHLGDGAKPCSSCVAKKTECIYHDVPVRRGPAPGKHCNSQGTRQPIWQINSGKAAELRRTIEKLQDDINEQRMRNERLKEQHSRLLRKMEVSWAYAKGVPWIQHL